MKTYFHFRLPPVTCWLISGLLSFPVFLVGQTLSKFDGYVQAHFIKTINDADISQNPGGLGSGLLVFYSLNSRIRATLDMTCDIQPGGTKELDIIDGHEVQTMGAMHNLLIGLSTSTFKYFSVSIVAGPSLILPRGLEDWARVRPSIKPSVNIFFPKNEKVMLRGYFIQTFKREKWTQSDFTAWGIGLGLKMF